MSTAVTVTVPVLVVWPAAIVSVVPESVKSPETAGGTAVADTVTTTTSLDSPLKVAVTVLEPPSSPIELGISTSATVGTPSSSVIVSLCDDGADTPLPPAVEADTVTVLSGASTTLSTAVKVTTPVLVVEPAAIVSAVLDCVKSPATPGESAVAETVTATASLDAPLSVAVTVLTPPFSPIDDGFSTSAAVGVDSSSVIVSVWSDGADTPLPPVTEPDTVTVLSDASNTLSTAVNVTTPVLDVEPAAIVSAVPDCVKSPETAGDTAVAETVTATASLDGPLSEAVTVLQPPFSVMEVGSRPSLTTGTASSSSMVPVADAVETVAFTAPLNVNRNVSSGSCTSSSTLGTVTVRSIVPGANVSMPAGTAA